MFTIPPDVFGLILTDLGPARSFAGTCRAAHRLVRSIFSICADGSSVVISSPLYSWVVENDGWFIYPLWVEDTILEGTFLAGGTLEQLLIDNYTTLGLAFCVDEYVVYELERGPELSYFTQYIELLGPIKCLWVGDNESIVTPRLGKFKVSVY